MSTSSELVGQLSELASGVGELSELTHIEAEKKKILVESLKSLLSIANGEVALSKQTTKTIGKCAEAHLDDEANLILVDKEGKSVVRPLESFEGEDFVRIVQDCIWVLQMLVSKEAEAIIEAKRPILMLRTSLGGSRLLIFDWRSYHVTVKNSGPDAKDLAIIIEIAGVQEASEKFDLARGEELDIDLKQVYRLARADFVNVSIVCRDCDQREYHGTVKIPLEGKKWQQATLERAKESPIIAE